MRDKNLSEEKLCVLAARTVQLARGYGAKVLVNGSASVTQRAGADGVHWTAAELLTASRRPDCPLVAASCHNEAELDRAAALGLDFVVLGPVSPTPSHPGGATLGWDRYARLIADYPLPVYALGGMRAEDLETSWRSGAQGIGMMRNVWTGNEALGLTALMAGFA